MLRLVEFALVLFEPTGLEFAIGLWHGIACGARKRVLACLSEGGVSIARASWSSPASSAAVGTNGSELEGTICGREQMVVRMLLWTALAVIVREGAAAPKGVLAALTSRA
eukprot:scaffold4212_cov122-Isochrysis_galbana.AAC.6